MPEGGEGLQHQYYKLDLHSQEKGRGTGSYIPAPGHTMSAPPNSRVATVNMRSSWSQSRTLVRWKRARAGEEGGRVRRAWASGRRARSARRTLQFWERRARAKW